MGTEWKTVSNDKPVFEGSDRKSGELKWTGTRSIWFGSNSVPGAIVEVYASADMQENSSATSSQPGTR